MMKSFYWDAIVTVFVARAVIGLLVNADDSNVAAAPPQNSTTTPVLQQGTELLHEKINARAKQGDVALLFLGDSITAGWATQGNEVWEKYYAHRKAMNAGLAGDRTQNVLWRLENGNVEGIHPKLTVIMIGTNNSKNNTAEEIADGIKTIVKKVHDKLPKSKILLLAIFPRGALTDEQLLKVVAPNDQKTIEARELAEMVAAAREFTIKQRKKNADASRLASHVADNQTIFYMDIGDKFLNADGKLSEDIMPDYLHLTAKGYEIWAETIDPKVSELMEEKNAFRYCPKR